MKKSFLSMLALPMLLSCGHQQNVKEEWSNEPDTVVRYNLFDTSMKEGVSCYRIPSIVRTKNGDLITAIDERVPSCMDLKYSRDINIVMRRSKDNGHTWMPMETVVDYPLGQSASDPSMIVDHTTGEIFLFYNYMDLDKEKNVFHFHVISSRDNGETWSEARDITPDVTEEDMKLNFKFITSGRGVCTADGKLLHTIVNLQKGLYVFGSEDHGKTWKCMSRAIRPADESKIIELPNGQWMINSRVNGLGMRYVHISADKGKTWTSYPDSTLIDPSCNGSIICYSSKKEGDDKDRIIVSNAADAQHRKNLTIRMSYDNGKTWAYSKTLYSGGSAYSSLAPMKDGNIAVFYEKDDCSSNEVAIFSLKWLTDGEDEYKKIR